MLVRAALEVGHIPYQVRSQMFITEIFLRVFALKGERGHRKVARSLRRCKLGNLAVVRVNLKNPSLNLFVKSCHAHRHDVRLVIRIRKAKI